MIDRPSVLRGLAALPLIGTAACSQAPAPAAADEGPLPNQIANRSSPQASFTRA